MNSHDQRNAFRIPMPEGQKRATLRVAGRTFDVQLIDASALGVAVACPLTVALEMDDCCELHTLSGGSLIRVVRKEVFSDGILLGAVRTGDIPDGSRGLLNQARELLTLPKGLGRASQKTRLAIAAAVAILLAGLGFEAWRSNGFRYATSDAATNPTQLSRVNRPEQTAPVTATQPRHAAEQVDVDASGTATAVVLTDSDLRARKIFEQHKQLLQPEISRRLRLSPAQESEIQRAVASAEAAADPTHSEFWEAIRRCELQILGVLSPVQVKAWRQLNGT